MSDELRVTDWTSVGGALVATGSVHIRGALDGGLVQQLVDAARPPWQALSPGDGPVRQSGFGSYTSVAAAQPFVGDVGTDIVRELTTVCADVPAIPDFNEVSWTRYPPRTGHITAHRDPSACGGIIAVATLLGRATFRVWSGDVLGTPPDVVAGGAIPAEWDTDAGDLVLLRGNGWPTPKARCPMHAADPPPDGERMIMTFRHNIRGAGGGYDFD